MNWLRAAPLLGLVVPAILFQACSSDDSSTTGVVAEEDASPTTVAKLEAGAACHSSNDCTTGLDCLYPAGLCQAFQVCAAPITDPCTSAQIYCSCLGDTVQVCNGYSTQAVDTTLPAGACPDSGFVALPDAGPVGVADAPDGNSPVDATAQ